MDGAVAPSKRYGPYSTSTPAAGGSVRAAPANRPSVASHGEMWIMFAQNTASAAATGHAGAVTSSASGARRLGSAASSRHAAMLASAAGSASVGCHARCGRWRAKYTACSPVPLASSSTTPAAGRCRASTSRIGSRLRAVAGACCFTGPPSPGA